MSRTTLLLGRHPVRRYSTADISQDGFLMATYDPVPGFHHFGAGSTRQLALHRNPGLELVLVTRGELLWRVEDQVESVPAGSVFFTLPWQLHGSARQWEPGHAFVWVIFDMPQALPAHPAALRWPRELGLGRPLGRDLSRLLVTSPCHAFPASPALRSLIELLHRELSQGPWRAASQAAALGRACLIELGRVIAASQTHGRPARQREDPTVRRVRRLVEALRCEPAELHTLDSMAAACRLHRTRFADIFKRLTGDAPIAHLNRLRIERACGEIAGNPRATITEVAYLCGFCSSQYFARQFRRFMGISPGEWRRQHGIASPTSR